MEYIVILEDGRFAGERPVDDLDVALEYALGVSDGLKGTEFDGACLNVCEYVDHPTLGPTTGAVVAQFRDGKRIA